MAHGGPVGKLVGEAISLISNKEVRISVLVHIQRGGSPSPYDAGLGLVMLTGWKPFDPLVAIAVAVNILWSGPTNGVAVRGGVAGLL
jgi:hypothetical protein